jgi:hypothetical protein
VPRAIQVSAFGGPEQMQLVDVAAALRMLRTDCRGGTVAVVMCDTGLKYLSTDLWEQL